MRALVPIISFIIASVLLFDVDRLALSSYELFSGPFSWADRSPMLAALMLFVGLGVALYYVYRSGTRIASQRGALAALALAFSSAAIFFATRLIDPGMIAAPLLLILTYQLSTRRYRLWSIALPIAALFLLGYGAYPLFILVSLLLTSPLRTDPDPRLGELFLVVAVAFVAFVPFSIPSAFEPARVFGLGIVFVALTMFAVYRILAIGEENAHPFVALVLASFALFVLGDPIAALVLTLGASVLVARSFESFIRFFEVSNVRFKRFYQITVVVVACVLTYAQSAVIFSGTDRMSPELASSLEGFGGVVGVDARLAPAMAFYSNATPVPIDGSSFDAVSRSRLTRPVLEAVDGRFDRFVLTSVPPYADDACFEVEEHGVLVEVRVLCSLS